MVRLPMKIDRVTLTHARIPLVEPFRISNGEIAEKDGIIVAVAGDGLIGVGESSPMAGNFYSGDTPESKPSPAPYSLAFERLREASATPLDPARCVAIEDSRWGLESARGAGLRCVGVTNSYAADELTGAELVVSGLKELTLDAIDRLCAGVTPPR